MQPSRRLLSRLLTASLAATVLAAWRLAPGARLTAHWDAGGRPDLWLPAAVALTRVPALLACLWLLCRLRPDGPAPRALGAAATALAAAFLYSLGEALGLGAASLLAPAAAAAMLLQVVGADLWRALRAGDVWGG